ncbi:MAG: hypothetical protein U0325_35325 [Polyangiales bacterium]
MTRARATSSAPGTARRAALEKARRRADLSRHRGFEHQQRNVAALRGALSSLRPAPRQQRPAPAVTVAAGICRGRRRRGGPRPRARVHDEAMQVLQE